MNSVSEQKSELRKKMIAQRNALNKAECVQLSKHIQHNFLSSDLYKNAEYIHCFISMNDRNEVDTHPLIDTIISDGKQVVVPVTNFKDISLTHVHLASMHPLKKNKWGVQEPENGKTIPIDKLDIILVPLLAADRKGNRLGYGKGFYDRFLKQCPAKAIGLVFEAFILDEIPVGNKDVPLNGLISELGVYLV